MTTTYPLTVDSLPRPLPGTKRNAAAGLNLSTVIDNISDAIEAIEAENLAKLAGLPLTTNGNFDHFQRTEGTTRTSTTTYNTITSFAADRVHVLPAGASVTQARSTTVPDSKSQYSLLITGAASVTTVDVGERIRSAIVNTRGKKSQVFSCHVQNNSGAAFTPNLRIGTPGTVDSFGTITNRLDQALASCPDGAWTRVSWVFDPTAYTNLANGLVCELRIPSGSLTAGKTVRIAQFDLRPGAALAAYLPPDPDQEYQACLAYCWKSYSVGVVPGTDTNVGLLGGGFFASGGTNAYTQVRCPVPMWKIPTVSLWGKAGVADQFWNPATVTDSNASQAAGIGSGGFTLQNNTTNSEIVQAHALVIAECS